MHVKIALHTYTGATIVLEKFTQYAVEKLPLPTINTEYIQNKKYNVL